MLVATCHCGAVRVEVPRRPRTLTDCNCSICRRYGALWAYYEMRQVRITHPPRATSGYSWGDRMLRFVRCRRCGCVTHWEPLQRGGSGRMGVNARNFDPDVVNSTRIRHLDGASTWKFLD
jgi:hypothetical protein